MVLHKNICIKFEVEGRRYEAIGFLNDGELSVTSYVMLSRTAGENGGIIGVEDKEFLTDYRNRFPKELRKYRLAAGRCYPYSPHYISYFYISHSLWYLYRVSLDSSWYSNDLVLRRCT